MGEKVDPNVISQYAVPVEKFENYRVIGSHIFSRERSIRRIVEHQCTVEDWTHQIV